MYAYCTSSHMSKQFKKWPIKYHFGWPSWPAKFTSNIVHWVYIYLYNLWCIVSIPILKCVETTDVTCSFQSN